MDAWDGWGTGRIVLLLSAVLYAGIWVQLGLMHWAGAFKRWQMWAPVLLTPPIVLAAVVGVATREGVWGALAAFFLVAGIGEGLLGLFFHLQGMHYQIGGLRSVRNLLTGPPPLLPVAYSLTGVIGLIGLVWHG